MRRDPATRRVNPSESRRTRVGGSPERSAYRQRPRDPEPASPAALQSAHESCRDQSGEHRIEESLPEPSSRSAPTPMCQQEVPSNVEKVTLESKDKLGICAKLG